MKIKDILDRRTQVVTKRGPGGILTIRSDSYKHLGGPAKADVYLVTLEDGTPAVLVTPMKMI